MLSFYNLKCSFLCQILYFFFLHKKGPHYWILKRLQAHKTKTCPWEPLIFLNSLSLDLNLQPWINPPSNKCIRNGRIQKSSFTTPHEKTNSTYTKPLSKRLLGTSYLCDVEIPSCRLPASCKKIDVPLQWLTTVIKFNLESLIEELLQSGIMSFLMRYNMEHTASSLWSILAKKKKV